MNNVKINFTKKKIKVNGNVISFKGLLFYNNFAQGEKSVKGFFSHYTNNWINNLEELHGNYVIKVDNKDKEYIFSDNSGMSRLYYYKNYVYDSFLDLINDFKFNVNQIDYSGIVEYIQFGFPIFHTFFKDVKKLSRNELFVLNGKSLSIKKKNLKSIFEKGNDINTFYENFNENFKDMNIACDLTAGIDSRMNVALLYGNKVPFKTSISGVKNHIDVQMCEQISNDLHINTLYYDDGNFDLNTLNDVFKSLDGQYSILEYFKNYILTNGLIGDNVNIRISGAGGELYKYSWIMYDLPFIKRKKFTFNKIYEKRYNSNSIHYPFFNDSFKNIINDYQKELIDLISGYRENNNIKTYDSLCYDTIMTNSASVQMIQSNETYQRYCPLLELSIVRNGVNLSIKDRILYMMHRRIISKNIPQTIKYKTNLGLSLSLSFWRIMGDGFSLIKRLLDKIKNKLFHKEKAIVDLANYLQIYDYLKQNDQEYLFILKKYKVVDDSIDTSKIDNATYSRLITIAKLLQLVDNNSI